MLETAGVHAVFYVSGILAARYEPLMKAIVAGGHVIAAHGWGQEIIPATQAIEAEKADLYRCLDALEAASGQRPSGWISPRCTPSANTATLLAEAGVPWHSDYFDYDLPRVVTTPAGTLTAVPFTMEINDMPMSVRYGNEPVTFSRSLGRILEHWPAFAKRPACLDITAHAHVYGRVFGAIEVASALALVQKHSEHAFLTNHDALGSLFA